MKSLKLHDPMIQFLIINVFFFRNPKMKLIVNKWGFSLSFFNLYVSVTKRVDINIWVKETARLEQSCYKPVSSIALVAITFLSVFESRGLYRFDFMLIIETNWRLILLFKPMYNHGLMALLLWPNQLQAVWTIGKSFDHSVIAKYSWNTCPGSQQRANAVKTMMSIRTTLLLVCCRRWLFWMRPSPGAWWNHNFRAVMV